MAHTKDTSESKSVYEVGFHIVPTVSEDRVGEEFNALKTIIENSGGLFVDEAFPQLTELAYVMEHKQERGHERFERAYFGWIKFEVDPDVLATITEEIDERDNILRSLTIKTEKDTILVGPFLDQKEAQFQREEEEEEEAATDEAENESQEVISEEDIDKSIANLVGDEKKESSENTEDTSEEGKR